MDPNKLSFDYNKITEEKSIKSQFQIMMKICFEIYRALVWLVSLIATRLKVYISVWNKILQNTVQCCYNMVQFITMQWQYNANQTSYSHETSHALHSWLSYGVSIMRLLKKIDCVIMTPYCICISFLMSLHQRKPWYTQHDLLILKDEDMMMSWFRSIFCITGHLWGESISNQKIPLT